jgi:hypothetical protein
MLRIVSVCAILAVSACALETLGPGEVVEHGLEVRLTAPAEVRVHAPFEVRLTLVNRGARPVTLVTPTTCLATLDVFIRDERVPIQGSLSGCRAAIQYHEIAAGAVVEQVWSLRAELEEPRHAPVDRGSYTVRAMPQVMEINDEEARLRDVERRLEVR